MPTKSKMKNSSNLRITISLETWTITNLKSRTRRKRRRTTIFRIKIKRIWTDRLRTNMSSDNKWKKKKKTSNKTKKKILILMKTNSNVNNSKILSLPRKLRPNKPIILNKHKICSENSGSIRTFSRMSTFYMKKMQLIPYQKPKNLKSNEILHPTQKIFLMMKTFSLAKKWKRRKFRNLWRNK